MKIAVLKNFRIIICSGIGILIILIIFTVLLTDTRTKAAVPPYYKYYTSVKIESGDTLWKFADIYMTPHYENREDYIEEICTLNHIIKEDELYEGQYLTIPYYSQVYFE